MARNWKRYGDVLEARRSGLPFAEIGRRINLSGNRISVMYNFALRVIYNTKTDHQHLAHLSPLSDDDVAYIIKRGQCWRLCPPRNSKSLTAKQKRLVEQEYAKVDTPRGRKDK